MIAVVLSQGVEVGTLLPSGQWTMLGMAVLLASSGWSPRMLFKILQSTRRPGPTPEDDLA